jgi:glutathione S-transferase
MKLYYSPGACSLAPHVALRETNAEFEPVRVMVADRENYGAAYLAVNPRGRVPALELDGEIYTEAAALLVFIASRAPEAELMPPDGTVELARMLEWLAWFGNSLHIAYAHLWRPERFLPADADSGTMVDFARETIVRMNAEVEERIAGPWLLGNAYSLADIYSLPFYRWSNRIGLDMRTYCPRWTGIVTRMLERPAVAAALDTEGLTREQFLPA